MNEFIKKELTDFIFAKGLSLEQIKERFSIAWDISVYFKNMFLELRNNLIQEILKEIKQYCEFKSYLCRYVKNEKMEEVRIFKEGWTIEQMEPLVSYVVEINLTYEQFKIDMIIGIKKRSDNLLFCGSLTDNTLSEEFKRIVEYIERIVSTDGYIIDPFLVDSVYDSVWLVKKRFLEEFFIEKLANGGKKDIVSHIVFELLRLIKGTEKHIDDFISQYKEMYF